MTYHHRKNPNSSSADLSIAESPPMSPSCEARCQLRSVITDTPQVRAHADNRWPEEAYAANKAALSELEYLFAISFF
jgi:hypothetical protein